MGLNIKFEFSGPRTPQRNGKVERKFQTFYGRIRASLNCAELKDELRSGVWAECARTITFLHNTTSIKTKEVCPHELLFGGKSNLAEKLKSFGGIGVVTTKDDIQGKLRNLGTFCMFVGYSVDHDNDIYRMLNLDTKGIVHSRDIKWLNLYHNDWIAKNSPVADHVDDDDDGIIIPKKPRTLKEAWNCKDPTDCEKWQNAIKKEFNNMEVKKCGISFLCKTFQNVDNASNVNGSSKSNVMAFSEQDW
jgi:hypothetical protein